MSYRDEGDAVLARIAALTRELAGARAEIETLRRKLRGEPEPETRPRSTEREIADELESARALLANLVGEARSTRPAGSGILRGSDKNQTLAALRQALYGAAVRKLKAPDENVRTAVDAMNDATLLIERIADVAAAKNARAVLLLFAAR